MFKHIMVPVDLLHGDDSIEKAIEVAADMAKHYKADLHLVTVTTGGDLPGPLAHNPGEFGAHLEGYAKSMSQKHGLNVVAHNMESHDPAVEVDSKLLKAIDETGSDLVIMASHVPGMMEYVFGSHAGHIASHARVSVFVVR